MLIILDRDGVINKDSYAYIRRAHEWTPIEGSIEAIAKLSRSGYQVAIATNQSGVGRGYFSEQHLAEIHAKMLSQIEVAGGNIAHIAFCPHHPDEGCSCRKPESGLLHEIADTLNISDLGKAYMVGDSLKDLQAAESAGCRPVLVKTGNGLQTLAEIEHSSLADTPVFDNLSEFVTTLLDGKI